MFMKFSYLRIHHCHRTHRCYNNEFHRYSLNNLHKSNWYHEMAFLSAFNKNHHTCAKCTSSISLWHIIQLMVAMCKPMTNITEPLHDNTYFEKQIVAWKSPEDYWRMKPETNLASKKHTGWPYVIPKKENIPSQM